MSGEAEHGKQFARDLCSIRRARGVSLTDIHEATRMAYDLIKRFEHDALIDHPHFNNVYIRLFVRGYATRIGIDPDRALEAFERAMRGKYDGSLGSEYLEASGEAPLKKESAPEKAKEQGGEEPETVRPEAAAPAEANMESPAKADLESPVEEDPEPPARESSEKSAEPVARALSLEAPPEPFPKGPAARVDAPSKGASVATSSVHAPSGSGGSAGLRRPDPRWVFVGLLVIVITLVVWNLARAMSGSDKADQAAPSPVAPTASSHEAGEANEAFGLPLPDTLAITVVADKGSVAPIRVTLDEDLRRPYWLERGEERTFYMGSRIILEQQLDSVTVQVEGVVYPLSTPAGQDSAILTRATLDAWFSSLSR